MIRVGKENTEKLEATIKEVQWEPLNKDSSEYEGLTVFYFEITLLI